MNILFIENRYKTFTYEAIGNLFIKDGFQVSFLIQNNYYAPKKEDFNCHIIPFPDSKELNKEYKADSEIINIINSDRMQNFFHKKGTSYFYYYNEKIEEILDLVKPDVVFGESTAFHELITIKNCKKRNILYLNPSTCRYPKNRFSFYKYDTLEPYKGSNEELTYSQALEIINGIVNRSTKPDYMKVVKKSRSKNTKDKFSKTVSFIKGDTYNTPSPLVKFKIEKTKKKNIKRWDLLANEKIDKSKGELIMLYPLQMQPEANLDVWGRKHRDQLKLIQEISKNLLNKKTKLVVKPNPKSKYELSEALLDYAQTTDNITMLKHEVKMDDILADIDLVITVTGTIAIECILSNIPVVTLVNTINNEQGNCLYLNDLNDIPVVLEKVKNNTFPKISDNEKINFLNKLNKLSYEGRISDPFSYNRCLEEENLEKIYYAFKDILKTD
ncbi:hypothetical protein [Aquimarina sp. MMG016]|uniref:hypothetical protein n=1 Tax=Aquimarina sp. MMG016 TaxID=2822690 RepID=UPI001B3A34F5|nr:hypothetical protein [Aquimarina sp. MMG016]MBQ4820083.1 hypothetical protein [Aquimarina sp. MMG016]